MGSVPNRERFMPLSEREGFDYPPHHYTWWDRGAMRYFLEAGGLRDVDVRENNSWNIVSLSQKAETMLLGGLKRAIMVRVFSNKSDSKPDGTDASTVANNAEPPAVSNRMPLSYKVLNNPISRFLRTALFMPLGIPLLVFSALSGGNPGRTLVFSGRRGGAS